MRPFTFLLLVFLLNSDGYADATNLPTSNDLEDEIVYQKYVEMDKNMKDLVNRAVKRILPQAMRANEHLNLSSSCIRDAYQLISGLRSLKLSPLRILDAVGKVTEGFLAGNPYMPGDYDECMSTSVLQKDGNVAFKGQYCMLNVRPLLPKRRRHLTVEGVIKEMIEATKNTSELTQMLAFIAPWFYDYPIKFGLCVPSGCSPEDIDVIANYVGDKVYINATVAYCDQQDNADVTVGLLVAVVMISLIGLLALIGSSLDYYSKKKEVTFEKTCARVLLCFSVIENFPKLISTKSSEKSMDSLFGIRSLALFHIVLLHDYFCQGFFRISIHAFKLREEIQQFFIQVILNGFLTTETFFFLGGFLNIYYRMLEHESGRRKLSALQIIILRLWRIYPAYIFTLLTTYILAYARGPMASYAKDSIWDKCQSKWWQNILFINNFFPQVETCMFHTWYLAADMQLFLISMFTAPVLLRCAKKGIILHSAILVAGIAVTVVWAWQKDIMPSNLVSVTDIDDKYTLWNSYCTTLPHIAPYFTGMITGYIISVWKETKFSLVYQVVGWPVAAACLISMLFVTQKWNSGVEYTLAESALYFAFSRFLYVLAVAWLVVCCVKGYGGIINYILSLKIWIPITRISYMMYLISLPLQMFYFANLRMAIDSSRMLIIFRYMGTLAISGLMALALVLLVESPFIAMQKMLLKRKPTSENEDCHKNADEQNNKTANGGVQFQIEMEKNIQNASM